MAITGFPISNTHTTNGVFSGQAVPTQFQGTQQALLLRTQIRNQLGISANPNEAPPPNSISILTNDQREMLGSIDDPNQRRALETQLIDQAQQQTIMTSIGADQRKAQRARQLGLPLSQIESTAPFGLKEPPRFQSPAGMNFQQMSFFLNSLMQMMASFASLGNGFSSFLGGGNVYPQFSRPF